MDIVSKKREENPFEDEVIAQQWINSVEAESGLFRDKEIYPRLNRWMKTCDPKAILEIGSGQGICASKIDLRNRRYLGIEPSKKLLARANDLYSAPHIQFQEGNAYSLSVKPAHFDGIFSVVVWLHLEDLMTASKELSNALTAKGTFCIITANPGAYAAWEKLFESPIKKGKRIEGRVQIPGNSLNKNVIYFHTENEIINSFEKNGLVAKIEERFGAGVEPGAADYFILIAGKKL